MWREVQNGQKGPALLKEPTELNNRWKWLKIWKDKMKENTLKQVHCSYMNNVYLLRTNDNWSSKWVQFWGNSNNGKETENDSLVFDKQVKCVTTLSNNSVSAEVSENNVRTDQLWALCWCSSTEYPNMADGGPLNTRLCSWSRLYPAAGWMRSRSWTRISPQPAYMVPNEGCKMEKKTRHQSTQGKKQSLKAWFLQLRIIKLI